MSKGVNKVILVGNLGNEPETRYSSSGSAITNISLATSDRWRDKQTGEQQERTEWHRIVLFNRLAEIAKDYLHKGSKVYIEGSLRTRKWQDKSGMDRYTTEIVGNEMQMLDARENTSGNYQAPSSASNDFAPSSSAPANNMNTPSGETSSTLASPMPETNMDEFADDVPF